MIVEILVSLLAVVALSSSPLQPPATAGAVPIFDGKSFAGWEGNLTIFRIEDNAIVGGSLEEKVAGIQFRTRRIPDNHEVAGYQADMGTGWWGALYDESRRNKVLTGPDQAKMKTVVKSGGWNDYVIRAKGKRIQLWVNGVQTVDYTEEDPKIESSGVICPQIHAGPPSEAWYKDITIQRLGG